MNRLLRHIARALCAICILLTFASCEKWKNCAFDLLGVGRAWIEGDEHKHFDSKAQKHSFRMLTGCGHTKRAGTRWYIYGLRFENAPFEEVITNVEELPNGDRRVAADWVSFLVTKGGTIIEVEVQENKTGKARTVELILMGYSTRPPELTITQGAE